MIRRPPRSTLFPTRRSSDLTFMGDEQTPKLPRDLLANEQKYGYSMQTVSTGTFEAITGRSPGQDRKSTRLNSSHGYISYAVFCLKKKKKTAAKEHKAE